MIENTDLSSPTRPVRPPCPANTRAPASLPALRCLNLDGEGHVGPCFDRLDVDDYRRDQLRLFLAQHRGDGAWVRHLEELLYGDVRAQMPGYVTRRYLRAVSRSISARRRTPERLR